MKRINFKIYARHSLTAPQQDFLGRLIPFMVLAEKLLREKVETFKLGTPIRQSILASHAILLTDWGSDKSVLKGNNLFMVGPYGTWDGKTMQNRGLKLRVYEDWLDAVQDYVDLIAFFFVKEFQFVFKEHEYEAQLGEYCRAWSKRGVALDPEGLLAIIREFGLHEFDL